MAVERTLAILKPDCVEKGLVGEVIRRIQDAGFTLCALRMKRLSVSEAEAFYAVHAKHPWFGKLIHFMSSGPCVPMVLEKDNAVASFRELIGATDPAMAEDGTIRREFGASKGENIIHGSDSVESGRRESLFFFSECEITANSA